MTDEEKFRKELGEKAIEYAKSHSSDEEELKITRFSLYCWS